VSELLEMVDALDQTGSKPFTIVPDKPAEDAAEIAGMRELALLVLRFEVIGFLLFISFS
jgi:hypothetical protein